MGRLVIQTFSSTKFQALDKYSQLLKRSCENHRSVNRKPPRFVYLRKFGILYTNHGRFTPEHDHIRHRVTIWQEIIKKEKVEK